MVVQQKPEVAVLQTCLQIWGALQRAPLTPRTPGLEAGKSKKPTLPQQQNDPEDCVAVAAPTLQRLPTENFGNH